MPYFVQRTEQFKHPDHLHLLVPVDLTSLSYYIIPDTPWFQKNSSQASVDTGELVMVLPVDAIP